MLVCHRVERGFPVFYFLNMDRKHARPSDDDPIGVQDLNFALPFRIAAVLRWQSNGNHFLLVVCIAGGGLPEFDGRAQRSVFLRSLIDREQGF